MNKYLEYLHTLTQPQPVLVVLPAPQAAAQDTPDTPVIKASRYLGTRRMDKPNGTYEIRERWSSAKFRVTGYYVKLEDERGVYMVNSNQVRIQANQEKSA